MKTQDNSDILAYWLSNTSTLLLLLQRTLKASGPAADSHHRRSRSGKRTRVIKIGRASWVTSRNMFGMET